MNSKTIVRKGGTQDIPALLKLIRELALYEKAPQEVAVSVEELSKDFSENTFDFFVAEIDQEMVGMALYYIKYSTWKGKCIFLDDIVVAESHRNRGIGKLLFDELISLCKKWKVRKLEWQVLEWNEPAINFYKKYDACFDNEWVNCKLNFNV